MNLNIRKKLLITVLIPVLGLGVLAALQINEKKHQYHETLSVQLVAQLSVKASELVHELQKERGLTAGFLGAKGQSFTSELQQQRRQVDLAAGAFSGFVGAFDVARFEQGLAQRLDTIVSELEGLGLLRGRVDNVSVTTPEAIKTYTAINTRLLTLVEVATEQTSNDHLNKAMLAYFNFLQGKERAGIERAVLANTFTQDHFGPGMFAKAITLVSEQNTYFDSFSRLASPHLVAKVKDAEVQPAIIKVQQLRHQALNKGGEGGFGISASHWFEMATQRINLLKQLENAIADDIQTRAKQQASDAYSAALWLGALSLLMIAGVLALALNIVHRLVNQAVNLTATIKQAEREANLSLRADVHSDDELGQTAQAFNQMMEQFSEVIHHVGVSSEQLASTAEETSTVTYQANELLGQQQSETEQVAQAVSQMSLSVQEVVTSTHAAAESATRAAAESNEGKVVVADTVNAIANVSSIVTKMRGDVSELANDCNQIGGILNVIREIAEQTNLLALNAAIEAARAGETGRGFAVVADEVRSLAQRTQHSVTEIQQMTESLQGGATKAIESIHQGHEQSDIAVEQAKQAGEALDAILASVTQINQLNDQIATATEQQSTVTDQLSQSIASISDAGRETVTGASQMASANGELAQLASSLKTMVGQFKLSA